MLGIDSRLFLCLVTALVVGDFIIPWVIASSAFHGLYIGWVDDIFMSEAGKDRAG